MCYTILGYLDGKIKSGLYVVYDCLSVCLSVSRTVQQVGWVCRRSILDILVERKFLPLLISLINILRMFIHLTLDFACCTMLTLSSPSLIFEGLFSNYFLTSICNEEPNSDIK
jgi:hypothetical protein